MLLSYSLPSLNIFQNKLHHIRTHLRQTLQNQIRNHIITRIPFRFNRLLHLSVQLHHNIADWHHSGRKRRLQRNKRQHSRYILTIRKMNLRHRTFFYFHLKSFIISTLFHITYLYNESQQSILFKRSQIHRITEL